jgi:hypothetical protein
MNDVATAHSLQEWSALLSYVCYMCVGCHNRVITPVHDPGVPDQGVVCLLHVSWHSKQSHNHVLVAYSNTVYRLQITDSGVFCEEITFNLIRLMPEYQINV